ncbi:MAG TPA: family 43 glycosylhydrolase [Verrucomicrobiae bacterium]|nr:family 43 glycosylhydrolase [Verrucomicrobiae bacterium]
MRTGLLLALALLVTGQRVDAQKQLSLSIAGPSHRDVITGSLSYTIKVTNLSANPVSHVSVDDLLPATVQFLSATNGYTRSASISDNGKNVAFVLSQINARDTARITVTVLPMAVGSITNVVSLVASGMADDLIASNRFTVSSTQVSIHDPAMAREGDTYYLFSSGPGIMFYISKDMTNWSLGGRVFSGEPSWAKSVTSRFDGREWAPDISRHDGEYYLYYAVSAPGVNDSAIGLTINKTLDPASPEYQWRDQGIVLRSLAGRDLWNAIDPNVIVDGNGTPWMDFGSFWDGIKLVKLSHNWKAIAEPEEWYSIAKRDRSILEDDRDPGPAQIEGPFIFQKGDYYYLFVSWGLCCRGKDSTYKIMVGRSRDIRGPYLDKDGIGMAEGGGSLLLAGDRNWAGQGGCSVYDFDGKDYLVFHAYEMADDGLQKLRIARLEWDENGWPVIDEKALNQYASLLVK